uniref:DNA repair and recombination protein RAD54-like n=1 Tax=Culicoides sonorensis TaxID=179676 RepID=A0A336MEY5_CULSO
MKRNISIKKLRRSKAPSASQTPNNLPENGVHQILQRTENHIKELQNIGASKPKRPDNSELPEYRGNIQKFSVVFGKSSTKKHKTFSEDGSLEINQKGIMCLKNSDGRIITFDNVTRLGKEVEEGMVLTLGGYDVQIDEKLQNIPIQSKDRAHNQSISKVAKPSTNSGNTFKSPMLPVIDKSNEIEEKFEKRVYTVIYGPQTMKKHKTFDEDGTLEIEGKVARLKDERGKLVATYYNLKPSEIRDGDRIVIEGKEVEIVEMREGPEKKRCATETNIEHQQIKKLRTSNTFISPVHTYIEQTPSVSDQADHEDTFPNYYYGEPEPEMNNYDTPESSSFNSRDDRPPIDEILDNFNESEDVPEISSKKLIMPTPPYAHQFKFNTNQSPVQTMFVPEFLNIQLRDHQRDGIRFLYECVMGFHEVNDVRIYGAILADEMGLGKTIQTIALIYMLLKQNPYSTRVPLAKRALIVTNSSLVDNWRNEIVKWLEHERIYSFEVSAKNKPAQFANATHIPIMIISYETLVKQIDDVKMINFDIVVCDEGHRLKNVNTNVSSKLFELPCKRRIILTGTPIQNNLEELFALVDFVNPGILGSYQEFKARYENPIVQSQQPMILPQYKELGIQRQQELFDILQKFVLRRTQDVLKKFLPKKQEVVVICAPSQLQKDLYTYLLKHYHEQKENMEKTVSPLQLITICKKICNQPSLLNQDTTPDFEFLRKKLPSTSRLSYMDSSKLEAIFFLLQSLKDSGERIVLVSNSTKMLDVLMKMCQQYEFNYIRLDGSTAVQDRGKIVKEFNDPSSNAFVFLLSAKAGGTGLNLIGASRLVLYDNDWNPATDSQALSRIWRDGQTRNVYIYRLITANTIEEKIFQRQMTKTSLGDCVMEQHSNQKSLNFTDEELKALFALPENFDSCNTHEMLQCNCPGLGEIPDSGSSQESLPVTLLSEMDESDSDDDSPFKIRTKKQISIKKKKSKETSLQMHELMRYEHYMAPIEENLLKELCLDDATDIIKFIFRNVTEYKPNDI